ncbi:MAG: hypothetical protein J0L84_05815 [Verrucomicrobia bacterium]|nr:hypothetical protein [Verrucomicrobiota bacterium]
MKRLGLLLLACVLLAAPGVRAASAVRNDTADEFKKQSALGMKAAESLSQVTGVAISPLMGMGALGAWKFYKATPAERGGLPWYAQPWFFGTALLIVGLCMAKDAVGPVVPSALKKPLDVLELFENKASAILATGVIVPIALELFEQMKPHTSAALDLAGGHFAAANLAWLGGLIAVPVALFIFGVVWLVSHTVNVLILISPFATVDAALKSFRAAVLGSVTATGFLGERLGAAWSLIVVLVCVLLAPWAFRTVVFGTLFAWDLVTFRRRRFAPSGQGNWMFTSRPLGAAPTRTYGRMLRSDSGRLEFVWRPWLVFPARTERVPEGRYLVGRGFIHSEILRQDGERATDVFNLPPRCNGHEEALAQIYALDEVRPVGLRAAWAWLRGLVQGPSEPVRT